MINFSDIDFFIYTFFYIIKKEEQKNRPRQVNPVRVCSLFYALMSQALSTDPNNSIFSLTVALIASKPGARSLRGSYPLPC